MSFTVFANFRIDSEERLQRMKDSLESFRACSATEWVINVRGGLREPATQFLRQVLGARLKLHQLESKQGWRADSQKMLSDITGRIVLFWIEDHICTSGTDYLDQVIRDMNSSAVDYLDYTWFNDGQIIRGFDGLALSDSASILFLDYGRSENAVRQENCKRITGGARYIISVAAIFSRALFAELLRKRDPWFRRWPKETPFDFEKRSGDEHWLPFRVGLCKREIFASIDDDHGFPAGSLIARGVYPKRIERTELLDLRDGRKGFLARNLKKVVSNSPKLVRLMSLMKRIKYQF